MYLIVSIITNPMAMAIDRLNYNPIRITEGRDVQIVEINEVDDE